MSRGDRNKRYALIALGLALFFIALCLWIEKQYQYQENRGGDAYQNYSNNQYGPAEGHWLPEFSARDTYAQWIVAFLTIIATIISGWAVWLVYGSLELNRKAVDAAIAANVQSRELFLLENRPWLRIKSAKFNTFSDEYRGKVRYFVASIENIGSSHAVHVNVSAKYIENFISTIGPNVIRDFAETCTSNIIYDDRTIFGGDKADVFPSGELIDETSGSLIVCVSYRSSLDAEKIYKTACIVDLSGDRCVIRNGGTYVS